MNTIARRTLLTSINVVLAGVSALALTGPTLASHVLVHTTVPGDATLGEIVRVPVALQSDNGAPLREATVVFYLHADFAGVTGDMEIGRAVTDEAGVATLVYRPRLAGSHELRMEYTTPGQSEAEVITTTFNVAGGEQLHRSARSVEIPGVGGGLVMAVLATVWSILLWVTFRFLWIARTGGDSTTRAWDRTR